MTQRYSLFRRGGIFYAQDSESGQQTSLRTKDRSEALALLHARNEAFRQPLLNLQMARTYLAASDPEVSKRNWSAVMDAMGRNKTGVTLHRHVTAMKDHAFDLIRDEPILETQALHFTRVLDAGGVSTNVFLRRLHNFALGMNWLPWPILPQRRWPKIRFKEKRAVTEEEHRRIVDGEHNPERRAFYECCWHLGGSQSDVATLSAEDVDWVNQVVSFHRKKTGTPARRRPKSYCRPLKITSGRRKRVILCESRVPEVGLRRLGERYIGQATRVAVDQVGAFQRVLLLPVCADGIGDSHEPRSVLGQLEHFRGGEVLDSIRGRVAEGAKESGRHQDWNIV